jgi:hypothetical protein
MADEDRQENEKNFWHPAFRAALRLEFEQYVALFKDADISDVSITFIENRHPRELLEHLTMVRNWTVTEKWPGIYHVEGDFIPIQIIETKCLEENEDVWLSNLRDDLDSTRGKTIAKVFSPRNNEPDVKAYLAVVLRVNPIASEEARKMTEREYTDRWWAVMAPYYVADMQRGKQTAKEEGKKEDARNALKEGLPIQTISKITGLDTATIQQLSAQ